jgi:hypothetical protein
MPTCGAQSHFSDLKRSDSAGSWRKEGSGPAHERSTHPWLADGLHFAVQVVGMVSQHVKHRDVFCN